MYVKESHSKRVLAIAALSILAVSLSSAPSFASDKNEKSTKVVASKMEVKKKPTPFATKALCSTTTASAHKEPAIQPPAVKLPVKNRTFTFSTNCGDIVIEADGAKAPLTVLVMTALAKGGYFNQTLCHRLTTCLLYTSPSPRD